MTVTNIFCILLKSTKQIIIISLFENNWFIKIRVVFWWFCVHNEKPKLKIRIDHQNRCNRKLTDSLQSFL